METFTSLRENSKSDKLNRFLRNIYNGKIEVKVLSVKYVGVDTLRAELDSDIDDLLTFTFSTVYSCAYGTFNIYSKPLFRDEPYSRPCTSVIIDSDCEPFEAVATEKIKDAVDKYMDENKVEGYKPVYSDVHDHSWLLNNKGWM